MKVLTRAAAAAALTILPLLSLPGLARAQASDSYVLRPGQLRLQVGARYAGYDERYGARGPEPLAAALLQPLTAATFAPLQPLAADLATFLASTPGGTTVPVDGSTLTLGTPDLGLFESIVRAPMELALGVLPRVELGVSVPVLRGEHMVERFTLAGGTVGANPAPAANATLLAGIGPQWAALGRADFLPTAGSVLGQALQARVGALTGGQSLQLPSTPGDTALFQQQLVTAFGVPPIRSRVDRLRLGDVEVLGRLRLLGTFGAAAMPEDSAHGVNLRSTLLLGLRLPTGGAPDTVELFPLPYDVGRSGFSVGLVNDLFVGPRFWATVGVRYAAFGGSDVTQLLAPPEAPLSVPGAPVPVRLTPGSELEVRAAPRIRLVEAISLGVEYGWARVDAARLDGAEGGTLEFPGGSGQRLGVGVRYTTLPAFDARRTHIPVEVELRYQHSLSGPEGTPVAGYATVEARVLPRLWGR